jgi:hypothetical protein
MIALRGDTDTRPALTGKSTQNTRIERFWGIYNPKVNDRFKVLFQAMEERGVLSNRLQEDTEWIIDRYCLTRVFLARIQEAASNLAVAWDYHKLSTEANKTPLRLWLEGWQMSTGTSQQFVQTSDDNYASEFYASENDANDEENPAQVVINGVEQLSLIDSGWLESMAVSCGADEGSDYDAMVAYQHLRDVVLQALASFEDIS